MRIERERLFRELEPPPGGAAKLRARLRATHRAGGGPPPLRASWLGAVAVAVVAAVTAFAFHFARNAGETTEPGSLMTAAAFDRLLRRPLEPYELVVRRGADRIGVRELETSDPKIRVFRLEPSAEDTAESSQP